MGHTCVKSVVEPITFEIDVFGHTAVERIVAQVVAVQFSRQVWIPYVIDLRYSRQRVPRCGICIGRWRRRRLKMDLKLAILLFSVVNMILLHHFGEI